MDKLKIRYLYEEEDTLARQIKDIPFSDCIGIILPGTEMNPEDLKPFLKLPIPLCFQMPILISTTLTKRQTVSLRP
ncbi:MAG: hypothetical protein NC419_04580 [Muribaculaceae bacterium]|nr:hypothetical protein [Muribaculaceae bacterium]